MFISFSKCLKAFVVLIRREQEEERDGKTMGKGRAEAVESVAGCTV